MSKLFIEKFLIILLVIFYHQAHAINLKAYSSRSSIQQSDETSTATILGIIESCGSSASLDDNCVMQNLSRVIEEENNGLAKAITADYERAIAEGQYATNPECQTETNLQVNRNIGHCVLLFNYYLLKDRDNDAASMQYEMCLQGGMIGLAYQGNMAAQYMLSQIFNEKGISETAGFWKNAFEQRKGTEQYDNVVKCYG